MAQPTIQYSFNSGEWAPHLYARTDLEKYKSGTALLRNFFVDYRGGASTRSGTRYILRGYKDSTAIELLPFQASITVGFTLEFGHQYIRFHRNGAPVLETGLNITGATKANPCVLTVTNSYTTGDVDWIFVSGIGGMTQLNGKYFIVHARTPTTVTLYDLFGNPVDSTGFGTYTSGGTTRRIYTIASPYAAADLATLKYTQNVSSLILTHPSYVPYTLTYTSETNWSLSAIVFGSSVSAPASVNLSQNGLGTGTSWAHSYVVTAIDANGQESLASTPATMTTNNDLRTTAGTINIAWASVAAAASYNVYKAVSTRNSIGLGVPYGFIGNVTGVQLGDSNISPDFSLAPPIAKYPFATGSAVSGISITTPGSYSTAPTVAFGAPPSGLQATGIPLLGVNTVVSINSAGSGYAVNDTIILAFGGAIFTVTSVGGSGQITGVSITDRGTLQTIPSNPVGIQSTSGGGSLNVDFNLNWRVVGANMTQRGWGYLSAPSVTFSSGTAAGTALLEAASAGNPAVSAFFQQRLVLAGQSASPQTLHMSQPGLYYNFDVSNPIQDDDAIDATIVASQLSNIRALVAQPTGLLVFTDGASFLMNGGSPGTPATPADVSANPQSFLGISNVPPIVINYDILYVQSKGSSVRDSSYNFYANVFTGSDISLLSSHLFFGRQLVDWAWAEEPYKVVWAVRDDGMLLSLTFVKEQEFNAWAHHDTDGKFKSVVSIVEAASAGYQNFEYFVVERTINSQTVQYIEYMPQRGPYATVADAWTVDCGIQYSGSPATSFSGGEFLVGKTCTGLADGVIIPSFVMPASGNFTLTSAASKVTVGLAFTPQIQTLYIDLGEPTVQSKMKKLPAITLRVTETLGLWIGSDANNLVPMKDLVIGNVGSMTNEVVTNLVTGDAMTVIDPKWQEKGQIFVEQRSPYPASILGIMPEITVGDTPK